MKRIIITAGSDFDFNAFLSSPFARGRDVEIKDLLPTQRAPITAEKKNDNNRPRRSGGKSVIMAGLNKGDTITTTEAKSKMMAAGYGPTSHSSALAKLVEDGYLVHREAGSATSPGVYSVDRELVSDDQKSRKAA